jgi:HemY protein
MIRVLIYVAVLAALAMGLAWMADRPGDIVLTWQGYRIETSLLVGLGALLAFTVAVMTLWGVLRFLFRIPSLMSLWQRARHRQRGYDALARGMVAAGAGDVRAASKAAREVEKHLGEQPLSLLLKAQVAQLGGDRDAAERAFQRMLERPDTRVLGLRGLHIEARRRGDADAALNFAAQAHDIAPLPWAGQAVLEHHSVQENWRKALETVESNVKRKLIDRDTARRQRAVLQTAIAGEIAERDPVEALSIAREALKLAPELVPAAVLVGRLYSRRGDLRKATKTLEAAWRLAPHPDVGRAYVDVRPGDSANDRLKRAQTLARFSPEHPESRLLVARSALEARDFQKARDTMRPLIEDRPGYRPTVRACLLMADIEETENGATGQLREWLSRAARAPRDAAWIAEGFISDTWAPASPVTGKLDAFVWQTPPERTTQSSITVAPATDAPRIAPMPPEVQTLEPEPAEEPVEKPVEVKAEEPAPVVVTEPALVKEPEPAVAVAPAPVPAVAAESAAPVVPVPDAPAPVRKPVVDGLAHLPDDPGPRTR